MSNWVDVAGVVGFTMKTLRQVLWTEPKRLTERPEHQYVTPGDMTWFTCDWERNVFTLYGHYHFRNFPRAGDVVKAEMERTWTWFRLTDVRPQLDPHEMFIACAEPVWQEKK